MSAFHEIISKAAPIMAAVQSLFFYALIFCATGYFLDKKLETFPILFIILLFLGLMIGFFQLQTLGKKSNV